jgi:hypothetical protein
MPDHQGYLLPGEREILQRRFAPVLVLFPEIRGQAPYPDDGDPIYTVRGGYHPRTVDLFLKQGQVRYRWPALLRAPRLLFNPRPLAEEIAAAEQAVKPADVERVLMELDYLNDPRYAGLSEDDLHAAVRKRLIQQRLGQRVRGFDQPERHARNLSQWKNYFKLLAGYDPKIKRSVVYARLVQGRAPLEDNLGATEVLLKQGPGYGPYDVSRTRVALQYWFQYYYDDWANRHEGDWEGITVLVELDQDTIRQNRELGEAELLKNMVIHDVGYAVHEDGFRRVWRNVQQTKDGHPLVYVARGSQASYFAWRLEGYPASARLGVVEKVITLPGRLSRGRRLFGRRWDALYSARFTGRDPKNTDWVAADPNPSDRLDGERADPSERWIPRACRGVRRVPAAGPQAGYDDGTYHLETDDLFWLEMVQEYGVQWGEDSVMPGSKGPGGTSRADRDRDRADIYQLAILETSIKRALDELRGLRFVAENAIPELNSALQRLHPKNLRAEDSFPQRVHWDVYRMWAHVLREHPEAWVNGPGIWMRIRLRWALYPNLVAFIRQKPGPVPLLQRDDPLYHLKSLLALVRRMRYELQMQGSKWDNPFAWARYVCQADTYFYGRAQTQAVSQGEFFYYLDCVDVEMSIE